MATPRLLLGTGSTQYIISEVGSGSSYGGSARSDVTLYVPPGWSRVDVGRQTIIAFGIHIDSADEATFASRYAELIGVLENPQRDLVFQWDTGSEHMAMKVSTRDYVSVSAEARPDSYSTIAAMVAVSFVGERRILGQGSGSSGGIENPVGLQTAIRWEATFGPDGRLTELLGIGTFVGTSSVQAQARAGTWRTTWDTTIPSWLDAATSLKDMGATFEFDTSDTECVCTIRLQEEPEDAPALSDTVSVWDYSAEIAPHTLGHQADNEDGPPGGDGRLLTVDGSLTLRGNGQDDFGGPGTAPEGGEETLTTEIVKLIEHAKQKAGANSAQTLSPLRLTVMNGGWSASFSYSAIIDTDLLSWTESVVTMRSDPSTIIPASDGGVRVYPVASGDLVRVLVQWSCVALRGATVPKPFEPPGEFIVVSESEPKIQYSSTRGTGDDNVGRVRTLTASGSREYLLLPAAGG